MAHSISLYECEAKSNHNPQLLWFFPTRTQLGITADICCREYGKRKRTNRIIFHPKIAQSWIFYQPNAQHEKSGTNTRLGVSKKKTPKWRKINYFETYREVAAPDPWEKNLDGARLTFIRLADTDVSKLDFHLSMQIFTAALDFELARVGLMITGIVAVMDMAGFHLGYLPKVTLADLASVLKYSQMVEKRVISVHIINCNSLISQVMSLVRPFLTKDLANKVSKTLHAIKKNPTSTFFSFISIHQTKWTSFINGYRKIAYRVLTAAHSNPWLI